MDKKAGILPKEKPPNSLNGDRQDNWSRCSSFSSSSSDSTLFGQVSPLKRMASEASKPTPNKRSRNSSGSSVSSNMSCVSDKDAKKTLLLAVPTEDAFNLRRTLRSKTLLPQVAEDGFGRDVRKKTLLPQAAEDAFELGHHKTTLTTEDGFGHNLRRNIRKKACSCDCTCTTLVVRRYNKIGENAVEEETVISRKVETTCSPSKNSQELHSFKGDGNRRRRSEVEKLYDSLHEIEWAKNFSPDNILRQINIRQAASVSMFGNSGKPNPPEKARKRVRLSDQVSDSDAEEEKPTPGACHGTRSKTQSQDRKFESDSKPNGSPGSSKQNRSAPKTSKSKPTESDLSSGSPSSTPKTEASSDETLCLNTFCGEIPDAEMNFFDIAEESMRTMDACFWEVGAEVVISTCYEMDSELPHLSPVKDGSASYNRTANDTPPVLECCVSNPAEQTDPEQTGTDSPNPTECNNSSETSSHESISEESSAPDNDDKLNPSASSVEIISVTNNPSIKEKTFHSTRKPENQKLLIRAGRRILKKYLKYLQSKAKLKTVAVRKEPKETPQLSIVLSSSISNREDRTANTISYKSCTLSKTVAETPRTFSKNVLYASSSAKVSYSHCKSNSHYSASSSSTLVRNDERTLSVKESSSVSIHRPSSSTVMCVKPSAENERYSKSIPRPNHQFTCHYQSLTVYRYNGYSQVVLKLTRRNSIFLSVESLEELKDVMKKISQDPQCHTLILMGCGKSFCSGLDLLPLLGPRKNSASSEMAVAVKEFVEVLSAFQKPVVAVIDGPAIGLGVTILTHADICIASDASTFCMPQNSLGFFPEGGATLTLPRAVGSTVAMDLILRSRSLTATEAKDVGLISEVVREKDIGFDLVSRVKRLAENSLASMETTKAIMKMRLQLDLALVLESEVKLLPQMWLSESCQGALHRALDSGVWLSV